MFYRCTSSFILNEEAGIKVIRVEDVTVELGGLVVLRDIYLNLEPGLHVVLGRNGSGKSTLLKTMAGLVKPVKGRVLVRGINVHSLPRREAVKLIGYTWQNPYAGFVEATVKDELEFTKRIAGVDLQRDIIDQLIPQRLLDRNPFTLSGGEAKRVSIAMILAIDQPIWLLDEPFDYLDSSGVEVVVKLITRGVERGKVVVIASANTAYLHLLKPHSVIILSKGVVTFEGDPEDLSPSVLEEHGVPSRQLMCG